MTLLSPGVSISVTDDTVEPQVPEGTVPLIVIATAANKSNPSGTGIAPKTIAGANPLYLTTSQRDLLQSYGNPIFQTSGGTPLVGNELNEYGLLAAYQFLGISTNAYILRADIDLSALAPNETAPVGPPLNGTYWFNIGASSFGIFSSNGNPLPGSAWNAVTPILISQASQTQTTLQGNQAVSDYNSAIISNSGSLVVDGYGVMLTAGATLGDVVTAVNVAAIPNITAIPYRLGQLSYFMLVDSTGASIAINGTDLTVLSDLGLDGAVQEIGPNVALGNTGSCAVFVIENDNRIYQKLVANTFQGAPDPQAQAFWYYVGSDEWKAATPTVTVGTSSPAIPPTSTSVLSINGVNVTLTSVATIAAAVTAINAANVPNIFAQSTVSPLRLVLTNTAGGDITLVNVSGTPITDYGIQSVNGVKAYYASNLAYPDGSTLGDLWVRTTSPNGGANYVVQLYNSATATFTTVSAPFYTHGVQTSAAATAVLTPTTVGAVNVINTGVGYQSVPSVTLVPTGNGAGATATAVLGYSVASATAVSEGTGYSSAPQVTVLGDGLGASAVSLLGFGVNTLNVLNGGSNYTAVPTVTITGGNGSGATATAQLGYNLQSIQITNPGSGFDSIPSITFTNAVGDTTGSGAAATVTMKSVAILSIPTPGSGYLVNDFITLSAGTATIPVVVQVTSVDGSGGVTGAIITSAGSYTAITPNPVGQLSSSGVGSGVQLYLDFGLNQINLVNAGSGYTAAPTVNVVGTGINAAANVTLGSTGSVVAYIVTNPGQDYETVPNVLVTGGGPLAAGATAAATLTPTGGVKSVTMINQGSLYTTASFAFTGGGGTGAQYTANLTTVGTLKEINLTAPGAGYDSTVNALISGGNPTTAAQATVLLTPTSVANVVLTNGGGPYAVAPSVIFTGGGGTGTVATATINTSGVVTQISISAGQGGTGYTSTPVVSFSVNESPSTRLLEADLNAKKSLDPNNLGLAPGVLYVAYNLESDNANDAIFDQIIRRWNGTAFETLVYQASVDQPSTAPADGTYWYNTNFQVDVMVGDGEQWFGYKQEFPATNINGVILSGSEPLTQDNGLPLVQNDLWIDTSDLENYPKLYKYNSYISQFVLVDLTDHTTPNGIVFADARANADGTATGSTAIANMLVSNFVDPDAPDPRTYPAGTLLFNTRYSSYNVKVWRENWFKAGTPPESFEETDFTTNSYQVGSLTFQPLTDASRWVTASGNQTTGAPYMGRKAQRAMVVTAMKAAVESNNDIRAENTYFNLICAPGYVELISDMLSLNLDKKEIAFTIGDSPLRLASDGTSLSNWATNAAGSLDNSETGLVSTSYEMAVYYPWGYSTNVDGTNVVIPPSSMALNVYAYSDSVSYPWFAPAGTNRGVVNNATSVGYLNTTTGNFQSTFLNQGQRDVLYEDPNDINPIAYIPGTGLIVYGQKTRDPNFGAALSRVNVARLCAYLRYGLNILVRPFLFEPNDPQTRAAAQTAVQQYLGDIVTKRGITDYLVVCDESNNPPDVIDANQMYIDISIAPTRTLEFIYIPIVLVATGSITANSSPTGTAVL